MQQEIASLKEQLLCVLRDNQILKKAVSLQHQKNLENEEKLKEVQHLKNIIGQYQEQIKKLEVTLILQLMSHMMHWILIWIFFIQ